MAIYKKTLKEKRKSNTTKTLLSKFVPKKKREKDASNKGAKY